MQPITPHLWFDTEAKEATEFYCSVFSDSKITKITTLRDTPSGDCDIVSFALIGQPFMAISAGPLFKFNPSISFHVKCETKEEVDALWEKLAEGGKPLMELGEYPFSKRYGWIQDKYGLSWQIIYTEKKFTQAIVPALMFTQNVCGKAQEAIGYYTKIFPTSNIGMITEYGKNEFNENEKNVMYSEYTLTGQEFIATDSGLDHKFTFNEAISFIASCKGQEEIDYYWEKLIADGGQESQCGWLKDKFGVSWQIVPEAMNDMMSKGTPEQIARVTKSFLAMKKFDIATLERAYKGI